MTDDEIIELPAASMLPEGAARLPRITVHVASPSPEPSVRSGRSFAEALINALRAAGAAVVTP